MNRFRFATCLVSTLLLSGSSALLTLPAAAGQKALAPSSPALPDIRITYQAKHAPLSTVLREMAEKYHLNYVLCETPQPEMTADIDLDRHSLKDSLDAVCKPFDFQWKVGPGGVLLFEGKYANLTALPPLTRGEVWAILQDFQDIARPFRDAKGSDISKIEYHLTDSLTLAQWSKLRAEGPAGGLNFNELTPEQQKDLIAYVTSQEFDFFVIDLDRSPWLQSLTVDANLLRVVVIPPGTPDPQTGRTRDKPMIRTRFTWRGEERSGIGCPPAISGTQTRAVALPVYPRAEARPISPTELEHAPALPPGQIHLVAVNTPLRTLAISLAEQSGKKVLTDDAIADVRVSLRLDDVDLPVALDALSRPHDWRFFKQEDGSWKLARKRPGNLPGVNNVTPAMMQALPPALRRYMQLGHDPADVAPARIKMLQRSDSWNWKLTAAAESVLGRLYAGNLARYGKDNVVQWNDLPRAAQIDLVSYELYRTLQDSRVLSKGLPGYVTDPATDVIRFANDRMDLLNLEICGRNVNSNFNSGISLNNRLSAQKRDILKQHGLLKDAQ